MPSPATSYSAVLERNWQWSFLAVALIAIGIILLFFTWASKRRRRKALLLAPAQTHRDAVTANKTAAAEEIESDSARIMPARVTNAARADALIPNALETHAVTFPTERTGKRRFEEVAGFRQESVIPVRVAKVRVETAGVNSPALPKPVGTERAVAEIKRLLDGEMYNEAVIDASDAAMRRLIGAELFAAIAGHNHARRENALRGFTKHGYLDQIVRDLTEAEDAGKRASAARVLGIVRDPASVAALMAALKDNSEEVRYAINEALAELRSLEGEPLEILDERDENRDAPQALVQPTIDAHVVPLVTEPIASSTSLTIEETSGDNEPDRMVIEPTETQAHEASFAPTEIEPALSTVIEAAAHEAQAPTNSSFADRLENIAAEEPSLHITIEAEQNISSDESTPLADATAATQFADSQPSAHEASMVDLTTLYAALDDSSPEVRGAAAQTLHDASSSDNHIQLFRRVLREAVPERRRQIGAAIAASGLAGVAISNLTSESQEKSYEAFSLLFLMAKAGEIEPLTRAIEAHPNSEVRLPVMKLLALSGQQDAVPLFRRLAVRGSVPFDVRVAAMEALYQINDQPASKQMSDARG